MTTEIHTFFNKNGINSQNFGDGINALFLLMLHFQLVQPITQQYKSQLFEKLFYN